MFFSVSGAQEAAGIVSHLEHSIASDVNLKIRFSQKKDPKKNRQENNLRIQFFEEKRLLTAKKKNEKNSNR
jgi:hypothetical protein